MLPRLVLRRAAPCARLPLVRRSFAAQAGDAGGKKEEKEEEDIHTQLVQLHREEQQRVVTPLIQHLAGDVEPDPTKDMPPGALGHLSGVPNEQRTRKVRIFQAARSASQRASSKSRVWRLEWDSENRWLNPLMGWTSTNDPLAQFPLRFNTKEEAIRFARNQGYAYEVRETPNRAEGTTSITYSDNFLAPEVRISLQEGDVTPQKQFAWEFPNCSKWVNLKRTSYGKNEWKDVTADLAGSRKAE